MLCCGLHAKVEIGDSLDVFLWVEKVHRLTWLFIPGDLMWVEGED